MWINRSGKRPCPKCSGTGKSKGIICLRCKGYGSPTLAKLETQSRETNEGKR
jgi:DnaJ-class molecular chaperone